MSIKCAIDVTGRYYLNFNNRQRILVSYVTKKSEHRWLNIANESNKLYSDIAGRVVLICAVSVS